MKIKDLFVGWYDYTLEDFNNILENASISLDTNVILNLYRYSKGTSLETIDLFNKIKDRLVISYYVAEEYTRNRKKTEGDSLKEFDKYTANISDKYDELIQIVNNISDNKNPKKHIIIKSITKNKDTVINKITNEKNKKEELFNEGLENQVCNLIDNSILPKFSIEEFEKISKEGLKRIKDRIPPGYMDSDKDYNGDYHIFKSLIDYSKINKKDMIFVTDDLKEDWFYSYKGIKYARPELLNEFYNETGHKILIMPLKEFMKNKKIFPKISNTIIDEIEITSSENEKTISRIASRIKRYLYTVTKYRDIDSVKNNILLVKKCFRTILRICEGTSDEKSIKKYKHIMYLLDHELYEEYIFELNFICENLHKAKAKQLNEIIKLYRNLDDDFEKNSVIIIDNFIKYANEYMSDNYEAKNNIIKARQILKSIELGYIVKDKLIREIEILYLFIVQEEVPCG